MKEGSNKSLKLDLEDLNMHLYQIERELNHVRTKVRRLKAIEERKDLLMYSSELEEERENPTS